ncbi:MAG: NAD-dependent malic enzyme [Verrucomicrobia bacterium]|nr:NAD-dependent malic enzyme [Verrucomicrobiota bacterium]
MTPDQILSNPLLNKGTGFTQKERDELHLNGFLPAQVSTLEEQAKRRYENFLSQPSDVAKWIFLTALQNRNETLFYRLVLQHIDEMLPYVYTPTVGDVSLHFSSLFTHPRGLYISYPLQDKIEDIFSHLPQKEIDVIVVTDGERILGLGDLGAGGMAISVGKSSLYTLFGGIHPGRTLPILLDVGTNNKTLLEDPLYLGWRNPRISGKEYDAFVERFVQAVKKRFPQVLLQWEDFGREHARPLLDRYKDQICSFNDDIQGTAAVVHAAILAAMHLTQSELLEQRILVFGGGSAGLGICQHLCGAMQEKVSASDAKKAFYIFDKDGLVHTGMKFPDPQAPFARESIDSWDTKNLVDVISKVRPTILIGVSGQSGAFTKEAITAMAKYTPRAIIFPLSNPTSKCEAHPADLLEWTKGKAIIATGSPFEPVSYAGKIYPIAQCNNVSIFPGIGLGVIAARAPKVTDKMFYRAAEVLSDHAPLRRDPFGGLFPSFTELREISKKIAAAVMDVAGEGQYAAQERDKLIEKTMWYPSY